MKHGTRVWFKNAVGGFADDEQGVLFPIISTEIASGRETVKQLITPSMCTCEFKHCLQSSHVPNN